MYLAKGPNRDTLFPYDSFTTVWHVAHQIQQYRLTQYGIVFVIIFYKHILWRYVCDIFYVQLLVKYIVIVFIYLFYTMRKGYY